MPIPEKVIIPASKDPGKGHFYVSLIKSVIRIGAGVGLILAGMAFSSHNGDLWPDIAYWLKFAGAGFILAEALGILEEIV
ncbi:MAG: hypothetical protein CMA64_10250 [Euryarchaeota archaeon]|jgi:hypothetical protein|nr:hypothetical protein [Euryarchaeota archaeon]